jgi:kinesin family protein 15
MHLVVDAPGSQQPATFKFDRVLPASATQEEVFAAVGRPTVDSCLAGFHATVFAFGQTGAGKTHTMHGRIGARDEVGQSQSGLAPRMFQYLFDRVRQERGGGGGEFAVSCSMLEIHNDTIHDLLARSGKSLKICGDARRGRFVEGLRTEVVQDGKPRAGWTYEQVDRSLVRSAQQPVRLTPPLAPPPTLSPQTAKDLLRLLRRGEAARAVGETRLNLRSSRSHSVFTVAVERRTRQLAAGRSSPESSGSDHARALDFNEDRDQDAEGAASVGAPSQLSRVVVSKMHLVDLAGSERTGTGGAHCGSGPQGQSLMREAACINTSLSALGRVISVLLRSQHSAGNGQQGRGGHVPYRDSQLTYLLQESLGGNAKTTFVGNISPSSLCAKVGSWDGIVWQ